MSDNNEQGWPGPGPPDSPIPGDNSVVFVPARPFGGEVVFEVRRGRGEPPLGIAFTSKPRLIATMGAYQPYVGVRVWYWRETLASNGVDLCMFDPPMSEDAWRWNERLISKYSYDEDE